MENRYHFSKAYGTIFCPPRDCWLVVSMHSEGPATAILTLVYLVYLCL
jgi:hypothetical protein